MLQVKIGKDESKALHCTGLGMKYVGVEGIGGNYVAE